MGRGSRGHYGNSGCVRRRAATKARTGECHDGAEECRVRGRGGSGNEAHIITRVCRCLGLRYRLNRAAFRGIDLRARGPAADGRRRLRVSASAALTLAAPAFVAPHVAGRAEPASASWACEGLVPIVRVHVSPEGAGPVELAAAAVADVAALGGVGGLELQVADLGQPARVVRLGVDDESAGRRGAEFYECTARHRTGRWGLRRAHCRRGRCLHGHRGRALLGVRTRRRVRPRR